MSIRFAVIDVASRAGRRALRGALTFLGLLTRCRAIPGLLLLGSSLWVAACSEPVEGPDCAWLAPSLPEAVALGLPSWVTRIEARAIVHSEGVRLYIAAAVGSDWSMWRAESRDGVSLRSMSEIDVPSGNGNFAAARIGEKDHLYYVVEGQRVHLATTTDGRNWEDGGVVYRGDDFAPDRSFITNIDVHVDSEVVFLYLGTMSVTSSHSEVVVWVTISRDGIAFDRALRLIHDTCPDGGPSNYYLRGQVHTCSGCAVALLVQHHPCRDPDDSWPPPPVLLAAVAKNGAGPFDLVPLDDTAPGLGLGFYREEVVLYDFDADEGVLRFSTVEVPELDAMCGPGA